MKLYELTYLISPELKTEEVEALASEVTSFLQKEGGLITKSMGPVPKTLGYKIKSRGTSFLVNLEFSLSPEKLGILEEKIKKDPKILRYLFITKKPIQQKEEVVLEIPPSEEKPKRTEKKVELKDLDEKLEEILKE